MRRTLPEAAVLSTWKLSSPSVLGTRPAYQWRVVRGGTPLVLRRYATRPVDLDFELNVMARLRQTGWPVAELVEPPLSLGAEVLGGETWCLFTLLPGSPSRRDDAVEQRGRGRLLAELHEATAALNDLGQRVGYVRTDAVLADAGLAEALASYERIRPDVGRLMRWHLDRARAALERLDLESAAQLVIHGDFARWNVLFEDDGLTGVVDFETAHRNFRVADFALSWRGQYDAVVHGYEEVSPLCDLERALLAPIRWGWLFLGVKDEIRAILEGRQPDHGFEWQTQQLRRRSPLFGDLSEPYRP